MANPDVIGIDTFAQNLDTVLSNIVHMVQQQQATATLPLQVSRDWIIRCVQEQIAPDGFTIAPKNPLPTPSSSSNGLGPFFNTLPRELRDPIFEDCLVSGYPQFLTCSRAMREEGLSQIWEKGVYRMNFGDKVRLNVFPLAATATECLQPTQQIAERIQHLRIRTKGSIYGSPIEWSSIDFDALRQFGGSEIRRKSCTVLFEMEYDESHDLGVKVVQALETLVGFERVDLRAVDLFPKDLPSYARLPTHPGNMYIYFREVLGRSLGCPSVGKDEEGYYVRFHLRQYVSERSQELLARKGASLFGLE